MQEKRKTTVPSENELEDFFNQLWKLYPSKRGKGQVSRAKKLKLWKIGYDEIQRAVARYLYELQKDADWRKPQNGSTFFNSGYVDYLDENYDGDYDRLKTQKSMSSLKARTAHIEIIDGEEVTVFE